MEKDWTIVMVGKEKYYTLKEVCKELGYKTQKAFIELYQSLVHTFKGIISGKFVSIKDYDTYFSEGEENTSLEEIEKNELSDVETTVFDEAMPLPREVKKKFLRALLSKYHPDNNGNTDLFLWTKRLQQQWKREEHLEWIQEILKYSKEDFLEAMKDYKGKDRGYIMNARGFSEDGKRFF